MNKLSYEQPSPAVAGPVGFKEGMVRGGVQTCFSACTLCTFPYAGHEWVELHDVIIALEKTTVTSTISAFFIVRSFVIPSSGALMGPAQN